VVGDLNMTEHLTETTEAPLLLNKAREDEEHNKLFAEPVKGEIGGVIEEIKNDTRMITMRERKIIKKTNKTKKLFILSALFII
jgi:hypothetical protein